MARERLSIILAHQRLSDVNVKQLQVRTHIPLIEKAWHGGRRGNRIVQQSESFIARDRSVAYRPNEEWLTTTLLAVCMCLTTIQADVLACVQKYIPVTPEQAVSVKGRC